MKRRRPLLFFLLFTLTVLPAKSSQLIGIGEGLSSRQVYSIEKGNNGYMWFLTHDGIDRYNGLFTTHYKLYKNSEEINASPDINVLRKDSKGNIVELGKNGYIFKYNYSKDKFELICDFTLFIQREKQINASSIFIDTHDRIWINIAKKIYLFDCDSGEFIEISNNVNKKIVAMTEVDDNIFALAATDYIYTVLKNGNSLKTLSQRALSQSSMINYLYYHKNSNILIVSTPFRGLFLYKYKTKEQTNIPYKPNNIFINKIIPFHDSKNEVLIATNGAGVYHLNIATQTLSRFNDDSFSHSDINTNIIKDIYIDEGNRVWMAVYPFGISVTSKKESLFTILRHSKCNNNSLTDNQVNFIYEDSDKDIWFLTNNGISCYNKRLDKWRNILSHQSDGNEENNHVFISMRELAPGKFIICGYMVGVYLIDKSEMKATFKPIISNKKHSTDKYIRSIYCDKDSALWLGGYAYLKRLDLNKGKYKIFPISTPISYITAKNDSELWVGTYNGIFIFNKKNEKLYSFKFSKKIEYITFVYQYNKDITFIATNGDGLFIYNDATKKAFKYHPKNSVLNSNYIYCIIPCGDNEILLSTERGISRFKIRERVFMNWTKEQGLPISNFNHAAGIRTSDGEYYIGSGSGVITFTDSALTPVKFNNKMVFSDLFVNNKKVSPNDHGSPLTQNIDKTSNLNLESDQNTFSLELASINYDNQSSIFYSWMLEGYYNKWSLPSHDNIISYVNLPPGKYKLKVRSIYAENEKILQEKDIIINIEAPFGESIYAQTIYIVITMLIGYSIFRYIMIRKERDMSKDKISFFINTAHDVRTPLSLISAPLGEISRNEKLSEQGKNNISLAMKNTEILTNLTTNLINFEKEELYSNSLNVAEYNLNEYINDYLKDLIPMAHKKNIHMEVHNLSNPSMRVLIDKNKIDSVLRNIIGNSIKYTGKNGIISIIISNDRKNWSVQISDTGIGIPENDINKVFRSLFRSKNATNMQISGSGIGMLLTYRLIKKHKGKISVSSCENIGSTFKITFPFKNRKYNLTVKESEKKDVPLQNISNEKVKTTETINLEQVKRDKKSILVVEDNPEFRTFLAQTLSREYKISGASNGLEALSAIKTNSPDLIISDIMMPIMDGNELCENVKENVETSHIPIILLTALSDKESIIRGLKTKADKYVTKPFDIQLLQATISNIFANREIIKKAFSKGNFSYIQDNNEPGLDLDQEFLLKVTDNIKKNISKEINVDILCSYLNMSRSSFYNKIKALTDYSPSDYIRKIKMEEAARLLRTKNYTIAEVADMVGFGDPKYFTDIFKKYFDMPPSTYMKQN